ncbi:MAG: DUF3999 family protein [Verrucomicrobia bacterium]|nr:DUF3999 family protein [Verrucomicrobiota bacterium]
MATALLLASLASAFAAPFTEWPSRQELSVPASGVIKLNLPAATLDAAQPSLADLRIVDGAGSEVPYLIERPAPAAKIVRQARAFRVTLENDATVVTLEPGLSQPIEAVTLQTPASSFIKAVEIEATPDGRSWRTLATGQPIFRRSGLAQLEVPVPAQRWAALRLRILDRRTEAIPFTGAFVHAAEPDPVPEESVPVTISERVENPGQTRLTLHLGAANLSVASLRFDTPDPLFTRKITLAVKQISESAIREQTVAEGVIYRVEVDGAPAAANLSVPLEKQILARELVVLIQNDDSPPLQISGVSAKRRPTYALFLAQQPGTFALLTGHPRANAPRYDLSALGASLKGLAASSLKPGAITANPLFRAPEVLPEIEGSGAALDVAAWKFRKPLALSRAGVQQIELDLDVLARAQPDFRDLRLVRDGRQAPYVLEHPFITRTLTPQVTLANDPKKPRETRWSIKLPQRRLPVNQFVCEAATPLFQRELDLYEMVPDDRGNEYRRHLGHASWTQTPDRKSKRFTLRLSVTPETDTLFLVTDNGDNPPIDLAQFQFYHPVTRLLFKSAAATPLDLYYGNRESSAPRYDLSLVAPQLLSADKNPAKLGAEEQLKESSWAERQVAGKSGVLFWGILGVVVIALLVIITRLVPKAGNA